jgi:4-hydroxy-4-methyl-2-oxoglutarate aldolase
VITERPLLTVRRRVPRPTAASTRRFVGAATVHLVDAMDGRGALGHEIKAVDPAACAFTGPALTCRAGADDTLAILAAFTFAQPSDVVLAATEDFRGSAVVGDLFAAMARTAGVAAIVTDGLARDSVGITEVGVPVFASGISPNSAARSGPGTVNLPITISGVRITPGDMIVGDRDGVVVIPHEQLDDVYERLEDVRAAEASYPTGANGEVEVPEFVRALLTTEQVEYLD